MTNKTDQSNNCIVCGAPLRYFPEAKKMTCAVCGKDFLANACCENGHFVCDGCHADRALEKAAEYCLSETSKNPIAIMRNLMSSPDVYMHGPEHHVLVGASLLTACRNSGAAIDLDAALKEMIARGKAVPGGACGFWGCCGAAVSTGIFVSILTESTPLSKETWGLCQMMTAKSLTSLGKIGGPRCCKRNAFLSILAAMDFVREHFGIDMKRPDRILCEYKEEYNAECLRSECPFYE